MSKPTAVEYLEKICYDRGYSLMSDYFNQAKEMEKEQIMEAHGDERDYITDSGNFITISAEQYYNETYKKEEK